MNDERRLWSDEGLDEEARRRARRTPLQRIPARLVAGLLAALIVGPIVGVAALVLDPVLIAGYALSAAVAGAVYVGFAMRRSSAVIVPAVLSAYLFSFVLLATVALVARRDLSTAEIFQRLFGLSVYLLPWLFAGMLLWAGLVHAFEDRLFSTSARERARTVNNRDTAILIGWLAVALVWVAVWVIALSATGTPV